MEQKIRTRRIGRHSKDCVAVEMTLATGWRHWDTAWGVIKDYRWLKQGIGTSGPWAIWGCNDPDCDAQIAIRADDILALVPRS